MSLETDQLNELHWLMEMLHTIDVGLVVLDREYKIQIWNGFMENHSGLLPREVKDQSLFSMFDEIPEDWFRRKAESVFLLKNKAFTIWEQRPYLFKFLNYRPITGTADFMYQNTTFIPLMSATGQVSHLCLLVYDVTDNAVHKLELEKANADLAVLSQMDSLTQLFNRAHFETCVQAEFKRWSRSNLPSSTVIIDIDSFKEINDQYGNLVSEEVIKFIANVVKSHTRETDIAGRYGGDQFAVLLPNTDLGEAKIFAERIRKEVEAATLKISDFEVQRTVSIGIAEVDTSIKNHEAWVECANAALHRSKQAGSNNISLHVKQCS